MNKHITLLLLVVVLCSMVLVFVLHTQSKPDTLVAQPQTNVAPITGQEGQETSEGQPQPGTDAGLTAQNSSQPQGTSETNAAGTQPPAQTQQPTQTPVETAPTQQATSGTTAEPAPGAQTQPQTTTPPAAQTQTQTGTPSAQDSSAQTSTQTPPATGSNIKPESLSMTGTHNLKAISLHFDGSKRMRLHIEAEDPFPCKTFVLNDPDRLVVDLPGTWKGMKAPDIPQNRLIKGIRTGSQKAGPRLVLDMSKSPKYEVTRPSDNVVDIFIQ